MTKGNTAAPLAITTASPFLLFAQRTFWRSRTGFDTQGEDTDLSSPSAVYAINLAKLIPGDVIAFYTLVNQTKAPQQWAGYHLTPFLACLVLIVSRAVATKNSTSGPRWTLVTISLLTFICWIYAQHDWFWTWQANEFGHYIANLLLMTLAFVAPAFVNKNT